MEDAADIIRDPDTDTKKKKPATASTATSLKLSQTKGKGKGGKASSKCQAVLDFEQVSTHLKVKMPFNKSSDDSDKVLKVPEMRNVGQQRTLTKKMMVKNWNH